MRSGAVSRSVRVSVCMASFNGSQFLGEQLDSIASQLEVDDELVLVDDCSSDGSIEVAERVLRGVPFRVRTIVLAENVGHVRTFELAMHAATNEVLILADQDDVWMPGYVANVRSHFANNESTGLLVARPVFCDVQLRPIEAKNDRYRHPGIGGMVGIALFLLNRAMPVGCTMSIRRVDLSYLLPFPEQTFAHDHWIYARATLRGRMRPLNTKSILYRRHDNVITVKRSPKQMVATRLRLLRILLRSVLKDRRQ